MTGIELVKQYWPGVSDEAADALLWSVTCFPLGNPEQYAEQLETAYNKSNGNVGLAIAQVEDEMFEEFKRYKIMDVLKNG